MRGAVKLKMTRCKIRRVDWHIYGTQASGRGMHTSGRPLACSYIVHLGCET